MNVKIFLISRLVINAYLSRQDVTLLLMKFRDRLNAVDRDTVFDSHPDTDNIKDVYDTLCIDVKEISAIQANGSNRGD